MSRHAALLTIFLALSGCKPAPPPAAPPPGPLQVATVVEPMRWLVAQLGADAVQAVRLAPPGAASTHWHPKAAEVAQLQRADLVVLNGAGVEAGLGLVSLADSKLVRTAQGFRDAWIPRPVAAHRHGDGPAHSHGAYEGYTWLDPTLLVRQAQAARDAIAARRPGAAPAVDARLRALTQRLQALDARYAALTPKLRSRPMLAPQRLYGYLAQRYGLAVRTVPCAVDRAPSAAERAAMGEAAKALGARLVLWPVPPTPAVEAAWRGLGLRVVHVAPGLAADADLVQVLEANLSRLSAGLQ